MFSKHIYFQPISFFKTLNPTLSYAGNSCVGPIPKIAQNETSNIALHNDILAYPVPTEGMLNITNLKGRYKSLILFDNLGRRLLHYDILNEKEKILDISIYPSGLYTICIEGENEKQFLKITKQ
jgi:hypothetical protein